MVDSEILLRRLLPDAADELAEMANNFKIWSNLLDTMPHPYSKEDAVRFIEMVSGESPTTTFGIHIDGKLCGVIGINPKEDVYRFNMELGFWIGEKYWGRGIATEAARQIISIAFNTHHANRLTASVFEGNHASMKVLTNNGFSKIGVGKKAVYKNRLYLDEHYFELLNQHRTAPAE